ncbi:uncharacterized protein LOC101459629 [Ceratitis capitata]|uniref:uncharacterized protein LOC101459629 n=1 Tax=Ceratitis capitata TaxID=7213 RepID=UPI00032A0EE2|nr:uncharacterized protein LOC101459629 [Ceratitis capitata]
MEYDKVKFIRLVKANDCLYNKSNKYFKYVSKKKVIWENIGRELGIDGEECVRRWTNIRDRFSRESRRMTSLVNNGLTTERIWHLYDEMEFLRPHIIPRSVGQSLSFSLKPLELQTKHEEEDDSCFEQEEPTCDYECSTEPFQFKDSTSVLDDQEMKAEEVDDYFTHDTQYIELSPKLENRINLNESIEIQTIPSTTANQSGINKRKRPKESSVEQGIISALHNFKEALSETGTQHQNPAVQGFGQMIVESICMMSERKQALAMQKVTELVMNIKMQPDTE